MNLSESDLNKLEDYASKFLSITEISVLLDIDPDQLRESISIRGSQEYKRYNKGKINKILELRDQEIEMAKLGSTVAIELVSKYILNQKIDE